MVAKRPAQALREILKDREIGPSAFGEMVGGDYQLAHRWLSGKGFDKNPRNQRRAAKALGLPSDYFQWTDEALVAERDRQKVFDTFCTETELGRSMTDNERASLATHRFYGGRASVGYYQTALGLYRGIIPPHLRDETIRINKEADDEIARKSTEKKPAFVQKADKPLSTDEEPPRRPTNGHKRGKPSPKK